MAKTTRSNPPASATLGRDLRSLLTLVNGRVVWGSPKGPWASIDPCYTALGGQKWVDASKNTVAMDMHSCKATPTPSG